MNNDLGTMLLAGFLVVALLIAGPFIVIWSANTLFPALAIAYTWQTWLATILLGAFFRANVTVNRKD
jgi:hypothetical protein